ncbi:hypothetical protein FQZ97_648260 [compost metagenome]
MDGAVGAVHVDAAEQAHQQAGDQRGQHVGDDAADHQHHHRRQAEQGEGRLAGGRRHLVDLRRQAQHQEVATLALQLADRLPGADHQQGIAELELFLDQLGFQGLAVAPQADHVEVVLAAEGQVGEALADQRGVRRQGYLGHADLVGLLGEVTAAQGQGVQLHGVVEAEQVDVRREQVDQQHVAALQLGGGAGADQLAAEMADALDGHHVEALAAAQVELLQRLADQRRIRADAQAPLAAGQAVVADQVLEGPARGAALVAVRVVAEPAAGEQHVADAEGEDHQAERGEAEEAEAARAVAHQVAVHHHVGCGGDQGEHAADQPGEGQRHHQPARRQVQAAGDAEHHRDEDRHHSGGAHHRAEPGDAEHQQHQQARLATAGLGHQPVAQPVGDTGAHQAVADHEQRGDQHHVGIGEAGQGFVDAEHAGQRQGDDHQQGDHVEARLVEGEHQHRGEQQGQDPEQFEVHASVLLLSMAGRRRSLVRGSRAAP